MIVDIEVNGRRCAVDVQRTGDGWLVTVKGRTIPATVAEIDGRWSLLLGSGEGSAGPAEPGVGPAEAGVGPAEAGLYDGGNADGSGHVESGFSRTEGDGRVESGFSRTNDSGHVESGFSRTNDSGHVQAGFRRTAGAGIRTWRSYEVSFDTHGNDSPSVVHVNGEAVPISIIDPRTRFQRGRRDGAGAAGGRRTIVAPMPGRIVKVLVERGQTVEARQGVVVVEAMKMENELRAPHAGTVAEVHAREGMSVEAQALLIVLE